MSRVIWVMLPIAALALTGCGGGGPKLYPLSGRVLLNDTPIAPKDKEIAFVEFTADKGAGNTSAHLPRGTIGPDGVYTVSTNNQPGIEAGAWTARVVYNKPDEVGLKKSAYAPPVSLIAAKFSDFGASGFKVTAGPDAPKAPDIKVSK
ncbi:hypothetical protein R5W24_003139 [Gemmata sp. JC717]|uniref:hypothetical protein n=1 Tax=Gemmata algarum TaxID=2975278 RepID=UPI0021BAAC46|nr:hypothetical protein [Gemmata algarum]MDY3554022.1 hypothetical protein [Gemmata algarum]